MLSRSSSAYQPLEASSGGNKYQMDEDNDMAHEMTSIAVISNHPFRPATTNATAAMTASVEKNGAVRTTASSSRHPQDLDIVICRSNSEKTQWTNFHFIMCIGIGGFFIFWVLLLCKMYLPRDFRIESFFSQFFPNSSSESIDSFSPTTNYSSPVESDGSEDDT